MKRRKSVYNRDYRRKKQRIESAEPSGLEMILERREMGSSYTTNTTNRSIHEHVQSNTHTEESNDVGGVELNYIDEEEECCDHDVPSTQRSTSTGTGVSQDPLSEAFCFKETDYCDKISGTRFCKGDLTTLILAVIYRLKLCLSGVGVFMQFLILLIPGLEFIGSKYKFQKYWNNKKPKRESHFICANCNRFEECSVCPHCQTQCSQVVYVSLIQQLQQLLTDRDFYEKCSYYRKLDHKRTGLYNDIFDGSVYQQLGVPITQSGNGLTFTLSWDGAKKSKSGRTTTWPIFLTINEMDPKNRYRPENTIFVGLWYGSQKPSSNALFIKLVDELLQLEKGIECQDPDGNIFLLRGRLINCAMDLPAKADAFCMKHHGGYHACSYCLIPGFPSTKNKKVYYPIGANTDLTLRSEGSWKQSYARLQQGFPGFNGVSGMSVFVKLPYWSPVLCHSIDIMHLVSNLHKLLIKQWTSSIIPANKWKQFDKELQLQKIHGVFKRSVRSIIDDGSYYKCSEAMVFMLYMSPLLEKYLPRNYYEHHCLLVDSLSALMRAVTSDELQRVGQALRLYVTRYQVLYTEDVTLNVHLLIHASLCVQMHGPLWCYSCFPYESLNKLLMEAIHGTHQIQFRIADSLLDYQLLVRRTRLLTSKEICSFMNRHDIGQRKQWADGYRVDDNIVAHHYDHSTQSQVHYQRALYYGYNLECKGGSKKNRDDSSVFLKSGEVVSIRSIFYDQNDTMWKISFQNVVTKQPGVTVLQNVDCPAVVIRRANSSVVATSKLHKCVSILLR